MTLLQLTPTTEPISPAELLRRLKALLAPPIGKHTFPEKFISEMESYLRRNIVVNDNALSLEDSHCLACLKAHALVLAEKHSLSPEYFKILSKIQSDAGHFNYYQDGEEVRKIHH